MTMFTRTYLICVSLSVIVSLSQSLEPINALSDLPTSTISPSDRPTAIPSVSPSEGPTAIPSVSPSEQPTSVPSFEPSIKPSSQPTSNVPSQCPTFKPSTHPSKHPTFMPSTSPTFKPTFLPSSNPSYRPTSLPSISFIPTNSPTFHPTTFPTVSPTLFPTISFRPTPAPTDHPTPRPTIDPQDVKSFHSYAYDSPLSGVSAIRWGLYFEGAIYVILTFLQFYYRINELGSIKIALIYTMWLLIEIVILCGRADFMLNSGSDYEPHILENGELVYFKSGLWNLGDHSRHQVGCPYNLEGSYPAPDNTCMYWFMPLNANLVSQGWVQFSLGVGLIFAILFRIIAFGCKLGYDNREKVNHDSVADALCAGICGWLLITTVELILHFQQFISLLPIEVILPNAYCLQVQVPVATMKAVCRYKIAAAAIPIGLPMAIGGFGFAALCGSVISQLKEGAQAFAAFLTVVGIIFGMYGLTFVIFWLFGGIVLGFWYVFGGVSLGYLTSDTNLILVLLSSSVFFLLLIEHLFKIWLSGCKDYNTVRVAAEDGLELANQVPLG
jgi:hypothetical protein